MIVRNCSGGIVFAGDKVLLVSNDKHEWGFPKGAVKSSADLSLSAFAKDRVKIETDVDARVIAPCGKTNYEFYSVSRRKPVHNNISWFIMLAEDTKTVPNTEENILNAKFFDVQAAMDKVTYSQDRSLLLMAYQKYKELT